MAVDISALTESYPGYKTHWGLEQHLFSKQGTDLDQDREAAEVEGTGFGQEWENNQPGIKKGNIKIEGLAAMKPGRVTSILNKMAGRVSAVNAWFCTEGLSVGSPMVMQPASVMKNSIKTKLKDSVQFSLEMSARGLVADGFILLSPKTLLSGASGTGPEFTDLDADEVATFTGGYAQCHVWGLTAAGATTFTPKIQHSDDEGATWTDLVTFPPFSAKGAQRVKLPSTTQVNGLLQASWAATGTPTEIQVLLGFGRLPDLDQ